MIVDEPSTPVGLAGRLRPYRLAAAVLAWLAAGAPAWAAEAVHPACLTAYEQLRAGKLAEAAAGMAECGTASQPGPARTVLLYDRVQVLDRLGRGEEALAQMVALTEKANFETGLADAFSGPGAWSRDPGQVRARRATGISRADLLLDIAWRTLRTKDAKGAMVWAERSARHALTRFRPEDEWLPMDRDAGCAIALRGFARADAGDDRGALTDLVRGYVRGCDKLPVAEKAALLADDSRRKVEDLKRQFDALQTEVRRVTEANRQRNQAKPAGTGKKDAPAAASGDIGALAMNAIKVITENNKAVEPVQARRKEFLAAEAALLGPEPLFEEAGKP